MPTYDYQCSSCSHAFEEFQSITAQPLTVCPNCEKPTLKRLMAGGTGMIFKGSGFYLTDYGKGGSSPKASESKKTSPPTTPEKTSTIPPASTGDAKS